MGRDAWGVRGGVVTALIFSSLLLAPSGLGLSLETMGAGSVTSAAACVQVNPGPPPGVVVAPSCNLGSSPSSSSSSQPTGLDAGAVMNSADVQVNWSLEEPVGGVDAFRVLRGATPQTTDVAATVSAETQAYTDVGAAWSGEAVWYRVIALDEDGLVIAESMSVLVKPAS